MQRVSARLINGLFGSLRSQAAGAAWCTLLLQRANVSGVSAPSPSKLGQIVRLEELLKESREEVAEIWLRYHEDSEGGRVGSVLSADEYDTLMRHGKESPMFVLPMAKPAGYETLVVQVQTPFVLITGLEEFKRHGAGAPPYLTMTHYPELKDSHGLVLVRGDVIHDKGLNLQEARTLMELTRAFYCSPEDYSWVHTFNHKPDAFDFSSLLRKLNLTASS